VTATRAAQGAARAPRQERRQVQDHGRQQRPKDALREGFTLLEVMIAAILILLLFYGLARVHVSARRQMDLQEHRRVAATVMQSHLEGIRRDYDYDSLDDLDGDEETVELDGLTYTVSSEVSVGVPEDQATTIDVEVAWSEEIGGSVIPRSVSCTTILARGLAWNN
jgi:prepilin-type N-terminal cleavage/methylation domain-containing protein